MVQAAKKAAIYCRVSTGDQSCDRQIRDLKAFAERAGYQVVQIFQETGSGAKNDRVQRAAVMRMAQDRQIEAVLVTELTRWGRSTTDLLATLQALHAWGVSVVAQTGMQFDLATPQGKLMATLLSGLAEFERDLLKERIKSGVNAAKARGTRLGRPAGSVSVNDSLIRKHLADGRTVRWIAHEMGISKTTVMKIKANAA